LTGAKDQDGLTDRDARLFDNRVYIIGEWLDKGRLFIRHAVRDCQWAAIMNAHQLTTERSVFGVPEVSTADHPRAACNVLDLAADVLHFADPLVAHVEWELQLTVVTGAELPDIGRADRARGYANQNFILPRFGLGDIDHA